MHLFPGEYATYFEPRQYAEIVLPALRGVGADLPSASFEHQLCVVSAAARQPGVTRQAHGPLCLAP